MYYSCRNLVSPLWRQGLSSDNLNFVSLFFSQGFEQNLILPCTVMLYQGVVCRHMHSVYICIYTLSVEIMLNCYFWIMRYRTSILCAQRASQTLVSGALKSHTEVEGLLPLFWMLAYLGEISLFWASTTLNYILYAFYWCHRLLSPKEVNEKRLSKPKLYCFLAQISSFSSFSNSSDGTYTRSDYPRIIKCPPARGMTSWGHWEMRCDWAHTLCSHTWIKHCSC